MKKILIKNIKVLAGINTNPKNKFWSGLQMKSLEQIKNAFLIIEGEKIASFGNNEVINAATLNGAYAMGVEDILGSITTGKKANLIITKPITNIEYLPYAFGENKVDTMIINGHIL